MTAGRGLIHNEIPAENTRVHSLQLWVNLPAAHKMTAPRYQDLVGANVPIRREPGAVLRVFSGSSGAVTAPTQNFVPVTLVEIRLDPGASALQDIPADYAAFVVVLEGDGAVGADAAPVKSGDVVWLTRLETPDASEVRISAGDAPLRALLYAGRPLREPVVAGGPFVMNTRAEIEQAYADYRAGKFGPISRAGCGSVPSGASFPTVRARGSCLVYRSNFLASDAAASMTGAATPIDLGGTAQGAPCPPPSEELQNFGLRALMPLMREWTSAGLRAAAVPKRGFPSARFPG